MVSLNLELSSGVAFEKPLSGWSMTIIRSSRNELSESVGGFEAQIEMHTIYSTHPD